jgi:hypothetical protein
MAATWFAISDVIAIPRILIRKASAEIDRFTFKKSLSMNVRFLLQNGGSLNLKFDANITSQPQAGECSSRASFRR